MKQQVIFLNGGVPKENYSDYFSMLQSLEYNPYEAPFLNWNKTLGEKLGDEYEYFRAPFHDRDFADYEAWKIMFEKMIPYYNREIILIATSLGASFILKYLGENDGIFDSKSQQKIKIKKLFLIAPAIEDTPQEVMGSFAFDLEEVYSRVSRWSEKIFIYHSMDDTIVPLEQGLKLNSFFPEAIFRQFENKGHFFLETELPELIEDIKN